MKVKICGIKNIEEAKIINETNPDYMGFVFAKGKREVSYDLALKISKIIKPEILKAGVFVNSNFDEIIKLYRDKIIDIAQLHGEYDEDFIINLKKEGIKTIKVIKVKKANYDIKTNADFLLFDRYYKDIQGGGNKTFDWNININSNVPYFVAGGLNEQNIEEMAKKLNPYGVDVSSGAEENGFKTKEKVSNIIKVVKRI